MLLGCEENADSDVLFTLDEGVVPGFGGVGPGLGFQIPILKIIHVMRIKRPKVERH